MSTSAVIALIAGGALALVLVLAIVLVKRGKPKARQRTCGGCGRVWASQWSHCLFCNWVPVPRLEFICGPLAGQTIPLDGEVTTIGSVAGNTIVLPDPAVSRKHVGIRRLGAGYEMADLGSTNGVYVNGHRMPKKQLAIGDLVRVGNSEMVFRLD